MSSSEARLAPSSLRRAVLLLVPLALLGTALMGLLAQSASAEHAVAPPTAVAVDDPDGVGTNTRPQWSFTLPETTDTATCRLDGPSGTVVVPQGPCTSPFVLDKALPADGQYVFAVATVRSEYETTDGAATPTVTVHPGGTSPEVTSEYVLDTRKPDVTVTGPSGAVYTGWSVTVVDATAVTRTCTLTGPTSRTFSGPECDADVVRPDLGTADGTYTLTVTAVDAAGNDKSATSAPFLYDGTPPTVTWREQPTGPSRSLTPAWSYDITGGGSPTCTLTGPSGTAVTVTCSTTGYSAALPDSPTSTGQWVLRVTSSDAAGNSTTATSQAYVLDRTPPTVSVAPGGSTTGTDATITWTVSIGEGLTGTCALSDGTTVSCADGATVTASLPADATVILTVIAVDVVGNEGTAQAAYTRSTTPAAPRVTAPPSPSTEKAVRWSFTTDSLTTAVTCRLERDGALVSTGACTTFDAGAGTFDAVLTSDGVYTLSVTASNTTSPSTATGEASYVLDATEPDGPALTRSPAAATGSASSITWTWTANGTTECRLTVAETAGEWAPCTDTATAATDPAAQGTYLLEVRYYDALGNRGAPSSSSYLFDSVRPAAPGVTLVGASPRTPGEVRWGLSLTDDGVRLECRLLTPTAVDPAWTTCSTSFVQQLTADGVHQLQVRQVDAAGNTSDSATSSVTIDGTPPPAPSVTGGPSTSTSRTLTWTLAHADADGATFVCRLLRDGTGPAEATDCASNYSVTVTQDGTYVLEVQSVDLAGNVGAVRRSEARTVDNEAPSATATSPAVTSKDRLPTFTFAFEPGVESVTCALVDSRGTAVTGSCSLDLSAGTGTFTPSAALPETDGELYSFTLTATDHAGNATTSAAVTYLLDTTAPDARAVSPAAASNDRLPTFTFAFEPGAQSVACALVGAVSGSRAGSCTVDLLAGTGTFTPSAALPETTGETYSFTITVTDQAGNSTTSAAVTYRLDTIAELAAGEAPASPGNDRTPTWRFTSEPGAGVTVSCRLSTATQVVFDGLCTTASSFTPSSDLPMTSGTTYTLVVTVRDALGNTTTTALPTYRLDTVADLTLVRAPAPLDVDRTPTWEYAVEGSVSCVLTGSDGSTYTTTCGTDGFTPSTLPMTSGTTYTLVVTVTDGLGNVTVHDALPTYRLDTIATLTGVTRPPARGNDTTPTWTFTPEGTATCALTGPGAPTGSVDCSGGTYTPPGLPDTAGADYVLTVTVTDALGNVTVHEQPVHHLDTRLPVATVAVPLSPSRETSVTWTVAADEALTSATCELRRDGVVVLTLSGCPGSTTVTLPGDGRYDVVVTLVDLAGNRSTTTSTVLVHDATVPTAPAVSPTGTTTNRTTATWSVTGEGGTSVTSCRVTRGATVVQDWTVCSGTFSVPLPSDGEYTLEARSTDPVGSGPTTTATYLLDTVLPVAPSVTGPTGPSQSRTPAWTVTTESGTTTECQLVRGSTVVSAWSPCSGGFSAMLDGLPDGSYVLESRATDTAQNLGPVGRSAPYVLDTTAPLAPVVSGPTGPSQNRTPGFTWTGEAGARAECQLSRDGTAVGGWTACTSTYAPALDRDGTWTLTVRLVDAAGNVSESATTGGYVLDTTPPPAPVVTPPKTPGRDLAPSWGAVVEGGTRLECRLTGPDGVATEWAPCTLPHATPLTGRPDGAYVLEVRATDAAGNLSPVGSGTYVLDTVAPAAAVITSPASPSRSRTPSFTWTTEAGATTRCRLTSGSTVVSDFAPCTSPAALDLKDLPDGTYTLTVRVTDAAGNPGPAATGTYVLDTTGPAAPVSTLSPASPSPSRSTTWAFTYETGATLTCELLFPTGAVREITSCTSPLTVDLTGLPDGSYTLTVRAVDAAGNVGAALREVHVLDSTALAPPTVTGPVTPGTTRTPRWTISAGTTECRLSRGTTVLRDWAACSGGFTADLFGQPDGTYVLSVRTKDASGAVSAAVMSRYVLDTTAPATATLVAPPTPSTNRVPTWTIASSELGARAECRVLVFGSVLADWAPCAVSVSGALHPVDLTGLGDGTYTLVVRLVDAAGNRGPETSSSYVLDTSAPAAVGITGPPTPGNDVTPTWLLTSAAGVALECRVTSAAGVVSDWAPCTGEHTADLTGLPDGVYTLAVRAVSAAGTPGPETTDAYELVTAAPGAPTALALANGIKPTSNNRSPSWTFTLPAGTTGVCKVVRGTTVVFEGACSSGFRLDLSGAPDGSYTLTVRAVDAAGNPSAAVTSTYVLDTVPTAEPVFTQVPGATGSTLDPQWRFSVARDAKAQCRLLHDGRPLDDWGACATPFTAQLTGRPDGTYVLQVRAVDTAGNTSAPVSNAYLLDRTAAPVVTFTGTPPPTGSARSVSWTFTAPTGTGLECRVVAQDGSTTAWGSCTGGTYRLDLTGRSDQLYTLEVRTVGADGVRGAASGASYRLDTRPPAAPSFSDVPPAVGSDAKPVWLWDLAGDELVECRLVRAGGGAVSDWQECAESQYVADLTRLGEGAYALELRVTDAAGNVSPVTSAGYRLDTTAPGTPVFTSRPPSTGSDRTVTWTFAVPAGTRATCTVTRDRTLVREGPCGGRYDLDLSGLPDGTYVLTVRLVDAADNASAPGTGAYALRTLGLTGTVRVDPPPSDSHPALPSGGGTGSGRGGTVAGSPAPEGSSSGGGVPIPVSEADVRRSSLAGPTAPGLPAPAGEETSRPDPATTGGGTLLLPGRLPVRDVPRVLRDVVTGPISQPTLPLALLAIVLLFLLAQNRIDRRDPKLAAAPVEAEPELDFTAFVRRPGSVLP